MLHYVLLISVPSSPHRQMEELRPTEMKCLAQITGDGFNFSGARSSNCATGMPCSPSFKWQLYHVSLSFLSLQFAPINSLINPTPSTQYQQNPDLLSLTPLKYSKHHLFIPIIIYGDSVAFIGICIDLYMSLLTTSWAGSFWRIQPL